MRRACPCTMLFEARYHFDGRPVALSDVVDTETDYQAWLDQQKTFAQLSAPVTKGEATTKSHVE